METFGKIKAAELNVEGYYATELLRAPLFQALFECNILFKSKYFEILRMEHKLYYTFAREYAEEVRAAMNRRETFKYRLYRRVKGYKMGNSFSGVPPLRSVLEKHELFNKKDYMWEVGQLYYTLDRVDENFKEVVA